jgi:hypothetical protein
MTKAPPIMSGASQGQRNGGRCGVKSLGAHVLDAATVAQFQETTMDIPPIRSRADQALTPREIDALWGAPAGADDGDRLDVLIALVEAFEHWTWPIPDNEDDAVGVFRFVRTITAKATSRPSAAQGRARPSCSRVNAN